MMASKNISTKRKKKIWYGLYAPAALNNAFLGETFVYSPNDMVGKTISLNLSMVLNDMKKQNIITSFRVKETKDDKGLTELVGYSLGLSFIKRLVRRRRDKVDDSFLAKSKDDKVLRVKTVVMTNARTYGSANTAIRLSLRAKIKKALKEMTFEEFVNSLINIRLQKDWKSSLNKIYPVKFLEVRHVGLEELKKKLEEEYEQDLTELKSDEDEDVEELSGDEDASEEKIDESEETSVEESVEEEPVVEESKPKQEQTEEKSEDVVVEDDSEKKDSTK